MATVIVSLCSKLYCKDGQSLKKVKRSHDYCLNWLVSLADQNFIFCHETRNMSYARKYKCPVYTGRAKKSNPLGKIRYLWNCSKFFLQINSA